MEEKRKKNSFVMPLALMAFAAVAVAFFAWLSNN